MYNYGDPRDTSKQCGGCHLGFEPDKLRAVGIDKDDNAVDLAHKDCVEFADEMCDRCYEERVSVEHCSHCDEPYRVWRLVDHSWVAVDAAEPGWCIVCQTAQPAPELAKEDDNEM